MLFKEAVHRMDKRTSMELWMNRLDSVDKILERSNTGWQLDFWGTVRRKLVQQMKLLSVDVAEK
jgi:hypothetical protein